MLCYVGLWDSDGLFGDFKSFYLWGDWNGVQFSREFNVGAALFYDGKIEGLNFFPSAFIPKET